MTLLQVAEKLHVDSKALEHVEADRFSELGAPVYVRGHIKRYSELVHENAAELLEAYAAATRPAPPDLTQLPKAVRKANPARLVLPSLVVLIAFALVGVVWWTLQNVDSFGSKAKPQAIPATDGDRDTADNVGASSEMPAAAGVPPAETPRAEDTPVVAAGSKGAPALAATSRGPAAPVMRSASAPVRPQPPHAGRGSVPKAAGTADITPPVEAAAPARPLAITLNFASDTFAEVYDSKGKRLFSEIGAANTSRIFNGTPPLRVVVGNAAAVSLEVNGKATKIPASTRKDDGAHFLINRTGRITRARPDGSP